MCLAGFLFDPISSEDLDMRRPVPRSLTVVLPVMVAAVLTGCLFALPKAVADDAPKPAKKDNAAAIKPAQATLTASVEPAEAKPGDVVTFKVTAKLDAGFHISPILKGTRGRASLHQL